MATPEQVEELRRKIRAAGGNPDLLPPGRLEQLVDSPPQFVETPRPEDEAREAARARSEQLFEGDRASGTPLPPTQERERTQTRTTPDQVRAAVEAAVQRKSEDVFGNPDPVKAAEVRPKIEAIADQRRTPAHERAPVMNALANLNEQAQRPAEQRSGWAALASSLLPQPVFHSTEQEEQYVQGLKEVRDAFKKENDSRIEQKLQALAGGDEARLSELRQLARPQLRGGIGFDLGNLFAGRSPLTRTPDPEPGKLTVDEEKLAALDPELGQLLRERATLTAGQVEQARRTVSKIAIEDPAVWSLRVLGAAPDVIVGTGESVVTGKPLPEAVGTRVSKGEGFTGIGYEKGGIVGGAAGFVADVLTPAVPGANALSKGAAAARTSAKVGRTGRALLNDVADVVFTDNALARAVGIEPFDPRMSAIDTRAAELQPELMADINSRAGVQYDALVDDGPRFARLLRESILVDRLTPEQLADVAAEAPQARSRLGQADALAEKFAATPELRKAFLARPSSMRDAFVQAAARENAAREVIAKAPLGADDLVQVTEDIIVPYSDIGRVRRAMDSEPIVQLAREQRTAEAMTVKPKLREQVVDLAGRAGVDPIALQKIADDGVLTWTDYNRVTTKLFEERLATVGQQQTLASLDDTTKLTRQLPVNEVRRLLTPKEIRTSIAGDAADDFFRQLGRELGVGSPDTRLRTLMPGLIERVSQEMEGVPAKLRQEFQANRRTMTPRAAWDQAILDSWGRLSDVGAAGIKVGDGRPYVAFHQYVSSIIGGLEDVAKTYRGLGGDVTFSQGLHPQAASRLATRIINEIPEMKRLADTFADLFTAGKAEEAVAALYAAHRALEGVNLKTTLQLASDIPVYRSQDFVQILTANALVRRQLNSVMRGVEDMARKYPALLPTRAALQRVLLRDSQKLRALNLPETNLLLKNWPRVWTGLLEHVTAQGLGAPPVGLPKKLQAVFDEAGITDTRANEIVSAMLGAGIVREYTDAVLTFRVGTTREWEAIAEAAMAEPNWGQWMVARTSVPHITSRGTYDTAQGVVEYLTPLKEVSPDLVEPLLRRADIDGLTQAKQEWARAAKVIGLQDASTPDGRWVIAALATGTAAGMRVVTDFARGVAQLARAGVLGGFPLPNPRFVVPNILTAPLIMQGTVGLQKTAGGLRRSLEAWAVSHHLGRGKGNPATVLFIDRNGKAWTVGEVGEIALNRGITRSQASAELRLDLINDVAAWAAREIGKDGDVKAIGPIRDWLQRNMSLDRPNIWAQFAESTDTFFRLGVLIDTLAEGRTVDEAVLLARESLFDYGAITAIERASVARYLWFYSFYRQNLRATVKAMLSHPTRVARVARAVTGGEDAGEESDREYMQLRIQVPAWAKPKSEDERRRYAAAMPGVPMADAWAELVTVTSILGSGGAGFWDFTLEKGNPAAQTLAGAVKGWDISKGVDGRLGRYPDPRLIWWWQQYPATWNLAEQLFDLKTVEPDEESRDAGTYLGRQWRIETERGRRNWFLFQQGLLAVGQQRALRDYTPMVADAVGPAGVENDKLDPRLQFNLLDFIGVTTTTTVPNAAKREDDARTQIVRELGEVGR